jgi:hypothetical protein
MTLLHLFITAHPADRERAPSSFFLLAFPDTSETRVFGGGLRCTVLTVETDPHVRERALETEGAFLHRPALSRLHAVLLALSDAVLVLLARANEERSRRVVHVLLLLGGERLGFENHRDAVGIRRGGDDNVEHCAWARGCVATRAVERRRDGGGTDCRVPACFAHLRAGAATERAGDFGDGGSGATFNIGAVFGDGCRSFAHGAGEWRLRWAAREGTLETLANGFAPFDHRRRC